MIFEVFASLTVAVALAALAASLRRSWHYRCLAEMLASRREAFSELKCIRSREVPDFTERLAIVPQFLSQETFEQVRHEADRLVGIERSYIPVHKKGGTVAYETIIERAPSLAQFYLSSDLLSYVSKVVGHEVRPTPFHDQSSLSLLVYDRPGDHIGWHYDHNFYRGRHFTVLLPLVNEGHAAGGLSHARLGALLGDKELRVEALPNTLVIFEGAQVRHRVTPCQKGERRLVLSMTYCSDPRSYGLSGLARRIKDTAFFGVRALWT